MFLLNVLTAAFIEKLEDMYIWYFLWQALVI
jgi:hypothetical protein